jgi:hypothetical protein
LTKDWQTLDENGVFQFIKGYTLTSCCGCQFSCKETAIDAINKLMNTPKQSQDGWESLEALEDDD